MENSMGLPQPFHEVTDLFMFHQFFQCVVMSPQFFFRCELMYLPMAIPTKIDGLNHLLFRKVLFEPLVFMDGSGYQVVAAGSGNFPFAQFAIHDLLY